MDIKYWISNNERCVLVCLFTLTHDYDDNTGVIFHWFQFSFLNIFAFQNNVELEQLCEGRNLLFILSISESFCVESERSRFNKLACYMVIWTGFNPTYQFLSMMEIGWKSYFCFFRISYQFRGFLRSVIDSSKEQIFV